MLIDIRTHQTGNDHYAEPATSFDQLAVLFTYFDVFAGQPDAFMTGVLFPNGIGHDTHCEGSSDSLDAHDIAPDAPSVLIPDYVTIACCPEHFRGPLPE